LSVANAKLTGAAHQTREKIEQTEFRVRLNAGLNVVVITYEFFIPLSVKAQTPLPDSLGLFIKPRFLARSFAQARLCCHLGTLFEFRGHLT
jgi:hypothetical protein